MAFTIVLPVQQKEGWSAATLTLAPPSASGARTASFFLFLGAGVLGGGQASAALADKAELTLRVLVGTVPGCNSA